MRSYFLQFASYILKRGLLLLLIFTITGAQTIRAQEKKTEDDHEKLQKIQEQLREKQAGYEKIEGKERNILKELRAIDRQLKDSQQKLQEHREKLAKNEEELKRMQTNLSRLQKKYTQKHGALARRVKAIYKMGDLGYLTPLFAMSLEADVQQQMKYLQRIAESDRQLMDAAKEDMQIIQKEKEALEKRKQKTVKAQKEVEQQSIKVTAQKQQKMVLLEQVRNDKNQYAQMIVQLEESAEKLERLFYNLGKTEKRFHEKIVEAGKSIIFPEDEQKVVQSYGEHFRANKGKLLWPVPGKIITPFGRIKIGDTYTHYKGVDIRAQNGTPFYSVFKGMVKYADWFEGYGNLVIVDHGGNFYTLYAHADQISVKSGDHVETRQLLGKVGDTDSIKGSHLYFEIRANGKPENPQRWLAKVK